MPPTAASASGTASNRRGLTLVIHRPSWQVPMWPERLWFRRQATGRPVSAQGANLFYAGAFVTAEATVRAILRHKPAVVTLVAIGCSNGTVRADEDELCALYLRARLEGRQPNVAAVRALVATMPPPPDSELVKTGAYDVKDREIAAQVDAMPFAIAVRRDGGLLIAEAENEMPPQ